MITIVLLFNTNHIQYVTLPSNSSNLVNIYVNKPMKILFPLSERANMRLIKHLNSILHPLSFNGFKYY